LIIGRKRPTAQTICVHHTFLLKLNFSDILRLKMNITIKTISAKSAAIAQNGMNRGYCLITDLPSNEIANAALNKFSKHFIPKLKIVA